MDFRAREQEVRKFIHSSLSCRSRRLLNLRTPCSSVFLSNLLLSRYIKKLLCSLRRIARRQKLHENGELSKRAENNVRKRDNKTNRVNSGRLLSKNNLASRNSTNLTHHAHSSDERARQRLRGAQWYCCDFNLIGSNIFSLIDGSFADWSVTLQGKHSHTLLAFLS